MSDQTQKLFEAANSIEESSIASAERRFSSVESATKAFNFYKTAMLDINLWNKSSVINNYALFAESGREISDQSIAENLFLRINMPGSGKYDWVKVIEIFDSPNERILTVKPTFDPTDDDAENALTSHFFISESTNNFCLLQNESAIVFYIIGLEEKQNTGESKNILESIRNAITANVGFYLGIQKKEWTSFCQNFLSHYSPPDKS